MADFLNFLLRILMVILLLFIGVELVVIDGKLSDFQAFYTLRR